MRAINIIYENQYVVVFANGAMITARLQQVGRDYYFINEEKEFAINVQSVEIVNVHKYND